MPTMPARAKEPRGQAWVCGTACNVFSVCHRRRSQTFWRIPGTSLLLPLWCQLHRCPCRPMGELENAHRQAQAVPRRLLQTNGVRLAQADS